MSNQPASFASSALKRSESGTVNVNGVDTAYWKYSANRSDAPTLLFIHGYRGNHHGLEAIAGALPDFNVIIPDLPGFGQSEEFSSDHSILSYADWLVNLIKNLKLNSPIVLGHSFGTIVTAAAVAAKADVSRVILVNPVSAPALKGPRALLTWLTQAVHWFTQVLPEPVGNYLLRSRLFVRSMSVIMAKTRDSELRAWIHAQHDTNFNNYTSRRVALEGYRASISNCVSDYAHLIWQPTLLIAGDKDDITSVSEQVRVTKEFGNAELVVLTGVGHLTHYERPGEVAEAVRNFCQVQK